MTDKMNLLHKKPLSTAVLFLVFNRLDTTKEVFKAIRKAKPSRIYIASDGPRKIKNNEADKVKEVRSYIINNIDWQCDVNTLFREENLGCKIAVSTAIDWFFDNEEQGIILEDDCFPSQSFFWFCEELLDRYKDDLRIGQIGGSNFQNGKKRGDADYYFSIYNHIWGWASWSNRWRDYNVNLENFENSHFINRILTDKRAIKYWNNIYEDMKEQKIDTWDYQWTFTLWAKKQLTILPNLNLIKNIGFGPEATHTVHNSKLSKINNFELLLKEHPVEVRQNKAADNFTSKEVFVLSHFKRALNKLLGMVHK